jgi:hypothetical protein
MSVSRLLSLLVCLLLATSLVLAQTDRSAITGLILDPAGAVVVNANVEVRNVDTGAVFAGGPSSTGNYVISVPRGNYSLTVTSPGFKTYVRQNLEVPVATTVRQDVTLEVGSNTETITVTDAAPLLKTESGDISYNVRTDRANQLPVLSLNGNIRNPLQVITLLPGASFGNNSVFRINGMPANTQAIRIEGQDATNGIWKQQTQVSQSGVDAIEEVAVMTSNFAAEYGQAGGGYVNMTMKSGTNQYHGSAYAYMVNEFMHAGTPYTDAGLTDSRKAGQHIRNKQRRLDYGFTFGGPIVVPRLYDGHDRTFFFFNFEQYRENTFTNTAQSTVPTEAYRRGDFSCANLGGPACGGANALPNLTRGGQPALDPAGRPIPQNGIYDPRSTYFGPNGEVLRNLFSPFNVIAATQIDPVAARIQALLPLPAGPNASQLVNNYAVPGFKDWDHTTNPSAKIDHSVSPTVKISGYLSVNKQTSPNFNGFEQVFTSRLPTDNRSTTVRINYDQTITPTILLHLGIGYLHTYNPTIPQSFDQSSIGLKGFYADLFPNVTGLNGAAQRGGNSIALGVGGGFPRILWDQKPTANASLTWVKDNHTIKMGGELWLEGFPSRNLAYGHGNFGFSAQQTSLPWENGQGLNATTGFNYASFLLGQGNSLSVSKPWFTRLGNKGIGIFVQDTWKITRRLTLDYGLRYDYQTYLQETYGRMQNVGFKTPNPTVAGRLGATIFEGYLPGRCQCKFAHNYPLALGPRLSAAYQINQKTVFRGGVGISYGTPPENAQLSYNVGTFYNLPAPGYGFSVFPDGLQAGNPAAPGNPYGLPEVVWPNFDPGQFPFRTPAGLPPNQPFIAQDRNGGRPPRILSWSIGIQRELANNLMVEAAYVGNRGVWWTAPSLQDINANALRPEFLRSQYGIDINTADGRNLLLAQLNSSTARNAGFATPAYPGMPLTQTVGQQLRPYPQFNQLNPFLGPPLGVTWYDSLQIKATKRYSHGLDIQAAFTWQKELTLGVNSSTSYFTPGNVGINDIFNRMQNKQLSSLSRPFQFVISGSYITPRTGGEGAAFKVLSHLARDWQISAVMRYESGAMIKVPNSNNGLFAQLFRTSGFFSTATTYNRVEGQPFFANGPDGKPIDPNCKCFDPTQTLVLNPAAWVDAPPGQFGTTSPYLNDYRWQRQPQEAINLARNFRMGPEGKYNLQIRAEFVQNAFNRLFFGQPSNTNPAANTTRNGPTNNPFTSNALSGGFGFVNTVNGLGSSPRRGQLVARFTF